MTPRWYRIVVVALSAMSIVAAVVALIQGIAAR